MSRPSELNDVLLKLHDGHTGSQKWSWTPNQPHVYANIIEQPGYEGTLPSEQELNDILAQMQADWDAAEYSRQRKEAYPEIGDQLDIIFQDLEAGNFQLTNWRDAIRAIKELYPKP
jgi:hypothetical protein